MSTSEMNERYKELYDYMASSNEPSNMTTFGEVMTEMMEWMIANKPDAAQEWIDRLDSIRWDNYLTQKEAERIVGKMVPKAPWSREQWKSVMTQKGYPLSKEPCYNSCALWTVMNMIMSDSSGTIEKFVGGDNVFDFVHALAEDKLTDEDDNFYVRDYFQV